MNIGIPKERRKFEYRVGLSPAGVKMLTRQGHHCYVEHDAGLGAGFSDQEYEDAGARIVYSGHEVFGRADLLLKVARPLAEEIEWLRPETAIAGLLHLGSARHDKIVRLIENRITAIAYESITLEDGTVPIRRPLSEIGGTLAAQIGARLLQNNAGGKGILIGGGPGVPPAEVVVVGAGIAGSCAVRAFRGMGAHVTVLDTNIDALRRILEQQTGLSTMISNSFNLARICTFADIITAAILVPNERPPLIFSREMIRSMKPRSVFMDISIDEGGCSETSRPTTHEYPTYVEEGVIHYAVPNLPSAVARTASHAFMAAAFPYILEIANKGVQAAMQENPAIARGIATHQGEVRHIASISLVANSE